MDTVTPDIGRPTRSPPLPLSDLHRLQLNYQAITPVPSHASGSSDDLDDPDYPNYSDCADYRDYRESQDYPTTSPHQHYASQVQRLYTYPTNLSLYQHPYFKSEYACMPINMADVPLAQSDDLATKVEHPDDDSRTGVMEMDQEEVDAIIRNKRKVRDPKACYACHRRKVKCDRGLPCDSCVKRDHPELCSYERPTKKRRIALSSALAQADNGQYEGAEKIGNCGPNITVPKEQWESINRELNRLRAQIGEEKDDRASGATEEQSAYGVASQTEEGDGREGVHAQSRQMGTMHLGSRSVLAYMIGNRSKSTQDSARSLLENNILPNLGLDNETATYPFVDLWSTDSSAQDVAGLVKALPDDSHCREFWLTYRDIPSTIYPVLPDVGAFNQTLDYLLQQRADCVQSRIDIDPNRPYGVSLSWLALLFAVLASGSQSTGRPAKERELTSQVYICCSYQALRMSNFLINPSLETIEALLIIGNALSYNMNPGVSYVLLGMTLRSAFSMGLHVQSPHLSEHEQYLRARIWWALAWQDSHFSVSYDRPSSSILCMPELPYTKYSVPGHRSYVESMSEIIRLTQAILRERGLSSKQTMSWASITKYKEEVHQIWERAMPRLRDSRMCVSMTDHLERLALQLHCSYLISEICRPALQEDHQAISTSYSSLPIGKHSPVVSPGAARRKSSASGSSPGSASDAHVLAMLRVECIKYLERVVGTYVELRQINKFAARSWIGIQRSMSAAFLLGVLPETKQEPRVIALLTDLEKGIEQSAIEDTGFNEDIDMGNLVNNEHRRISGRNGYNNGSPLWVRGMTESLSALSKLNAALAGGKSGISKQPQQQFEPQAGFPPISSAQTVNMYNTPIISPLGSHNFNSMPMGMQQYPAVYDVSGRPGMPVHPGQQMLSSMGPYTSDTTAGGDPWNHGNMTKRASEFVQPGLWANTSMGR